jgi:prepilin-type N-terminal cleavage/methylation domain-containing protein
MPRASTEIKQDGFTLIELMIVIAIIGILAAIAIPQFSAYRARSFNAAASADLRHLATTQEAYFVDHSVYSGSVAKLLNSYGAVTSGDVVLIINSNTSSYYNMTSYHTAGSSTYTVRGPGGEVESM